MSGEETGTGHSIGAALRRGGPAAEARSRTQARGAAAAAAERLAGRALSEGLLDVAYATVDSPFGPMLAAGTSRGLVRLAFPEERAETVLERLSSRLSPRILRAPERLDSVRRELEEYFAGRRREFEVPVDWSLVGPFSRSVLSAAAAIPYGASRTYTEIACEAGSPRGSRAAGNALGSNPIPIVIPCHRVLRVGGALGGYAGGLERKRWLLELEGALAR